MYHYILQHSADGVPKSTVWVSPTATARGKDPSMRLFYIDSETYEVIDYERYGFSLADSIGKMCYIVLSITFYHSVNQFIKNKDPFLSKYVDLLDLFAIIRSNTKRKIILFITKS